MIRFLIFQLSKSKHFCNFIQDNKRLRKLTKRFVPGTTLSKVIPIVKQLNKKGVKTTIDFLGENVSDKKQAEKATKIYTNILQKINKEKLDSHISLKLSQIGLTIDEKFCLSLLKKVVKTAKKYNNIVEIDMEKFSLVDKTITIFSILKKDYDNMAICLQANLYRTEHDLKNLLKERSSIRLVKGGYREKKEVAFQNKKKVNRNYLKLLKIMFQSKSRYYIATHDDKIINKIKQTIQKNSNMEFEMLYGIKTKLQKQLARDNKLRVYIPYSSQWCPYLMRRMAERPANLLLMLKSLRG